MSQVGEAYEEMLALDEVEGFLTAIRKFVEKKIGGKTFAGMETDDVIQEVLLRVYQCIENYDSSKGMASTYFENVINNRITDLLRSVGSETNLALVNAKVIVEDFQSCEDAELSAHTKSETIIAVTDEYYSYKETVMDLLNSCKLSEKEIEIFKLRAAGYTYGEIAKVYGCSINNIKKYWHKILDKIKVMETKK